MLIGELFESPAALAPAGNTIKVIGERELIVTVITIISIIMKADDSIQFSREAKKKKKR